jgi:magnesium chelatase family protein
MDRIDIKINVPRIKGEEVFSESIRNYKDIIEKIKELKELQFKRQNKFNSELNPKEIKEYCKLSLKAEDFLKKSIDNLRLSLRAVHKIMKTAKTIADFENKDIIDVDHIAEALQYRNI